MIGGEIMAILPTTTNSVVQQDQVAMDAAHGSHGGAAASASASKPAVEEAQHLLAGVSGKLARLIHSFAGGSAGMPALMVAQPHVVKEAIITYSEQLKKETGIDLGLEKAIKWKRSYGPLTPRGCLFLSKQNEKVKPELLEKLIKLPLESWVKAREVKYDDGIKGLFDTAALFHEVQHFSSSESTREERVEIRRKSKELSLILVEQFGIDSTLELIDKKFPKSVEPEALCPVIKLLCEQGDVKRAAGLIAEMPLGSRYENLKDLVEGFNETGHYEIVINLLKEYTEKFPDADGKLTLQRSFTCLWSAQGEIDRALEIYNHITDEATKIELLPRVTPAEGSET